MPLGYQRKAPLCQSEHHGKTCVPLLRRYHQTSYDNPNVHLNNKNEKQSLLLINITPASARGRGAKRIISNFATISIFIAILCCGGCLINICWIYLVLLVELSNGNDRSFHQQRLQLSVVRVHLWM